MQVFDVFKRSNEYLVGRLPVSSCIDNLAQRDSGKLSFSLAISQQVLVLLLHVDIDHGVDAVHNAVFADFSLGVRSETKVVSDGN